jgi:hypothetical protein
MMLNPKYSPTDALQDRRAEKGLIWFFCFVSLFGSVIVVYVHRRLIPGTILYGVLSTFGWFNSIVGCLLVIYYNIISRPPSTNPLAFRKFWTKNCIEPTHATNRVNRPPILVCFGDVLVRGSYSSNFTNQIPVILSRRNRRIDSTAKFVEKRYNSFKFDDPLWVINAAENGFTSHVLVQEERIQKTYHAIFNMDHDNSNDKNRFPSHPNYVLIMTGTNDALCMTHHLYVTH